MPRLQTYADRCREDLAALRKSRLPKFPRRKPSLIAAPVGREPGDAAVCAELRAMGIAPEYFQRDGVRLRAEQLRHAKLLRKMCGGLPQDNQRLKLSKPNF